jgi:hypothetical protein
VKHYSLAELEEELLSRGESTICVYGGYCIYDTWRCQEELFFSPYCRSRWLRLWKLQSYPAVDTQARHAGAQGIRTRSEQYHSGGESVSKPATPAPAPAPAAKPATKRTLPQAAKQKLSDAMKKKWQDPTYRKNVLEGMRKALARRRAPAK